MSVWFLLMVSAAGSHVVSRHQSCTFHSRIPRSVITRRYDRTVPTSRDQLDQFRCLGGRLIGQRQRSFICAVRSTRLLTRLCRLQAVTLHWLMWHPHHLYDHAWYLDDGRSYTAFRSGKDLFLDERFNEKLKQNGTLQAA